MEAHDRIIVALDTPVLNKIGWYATELRRSVGLCKVGLEALTALGGPMVVSTVHQAGSLVMYDGKFHDIPATMGGAARSVAELNVHSFTIHASAGLTGIKEAVRHRGSSRVIGVTVLTSHDEAECRSIFGDQPEKKVLIFAGWLVVAGAQAIVCSPQELTAIRRHHEFDDLEVITPGVRPAWASANDQKRVMTPADAIRAGANRLVIGRPILSPPAEIGTPLEAARRIAEEINVAL
jgi:orotidine-5'-phosphate decarboxylase